jgi:carboxymethylenebutenolidase
VGTYALLQERVRPSRLGGVRRPCPGSLRRPTAATIEEAEDLLRQESPERTEAQLTAAIDFLQVHEVTVGDKLAALGFSAGASWALMLSTLKPEAVSAVVAFYGTGEADFSSAHAAYVGHYAQHDEWEPTEEVRRTENALRAAGREVTFYTYPGVGHWFFEEDRPGYYDAEAAHLAWERTMSFLRGRLGLA